jgi:FG-GAP repeat
MGSSAAALFSSRQMLDSILAKRHAWVFVAYVVTTLSLGLALLLANPFAPSSGRRQSSRSLPGLSSLPMGLQAAASTALGAASTAYATRPVRAGFAAENPAQRLRLRFGADGVQVHSARATIGLALNAIGEGSSLRAVGRVAPSSRGNRVTYRHPGFTEWFANGPLGLEQGFSIQRAPSRIGGGPLTLVMGLSGAKQPSILKGRRSLALSGAGGASLRYGGLMATDATGHQLKAWLELRGHRLMLRVDAQHALYPIEIDPFVQQGDSLTGGGESAEGNFGASVALSADGSTALIGAPSDDFRVGAAWVFTRSGSTWSQQGEKLVGGGERGEGKFGTAVALSADGNTALIGGIGDDKDTGAAWVFTRSGSTWSQQGEKLVGSLPELEGRFGQSVALSGDGATALIGCGPFYGHGGGAWVFTRSGSIWSQQGPRIDPSGEVGEGNFGTSVALSSDGSTALIGAPWDNSHAGAAWVFTRSDEEWVQQGNKLTGGEESGSNGFGEGAFGYSVALSAEGSTAMIGGPADTNESGAAWVFVRSGSTWAQQGPKLTTGEGVNGYYAGFGRSVALSGSGDIALIGGRGAVFERSGSTWIEEQSGLFTGEGPERESGESVALSADGATALIGSPYATVGNIGSAGRAYAYTSLPQAPRVVPAPASAITASSATLNAKVNPNGYEVSKCEFEYGVSPAYEHSVPCESLPGAGESLVAVSAPVSGLSEETTYHFRVVATNSIGTSDGADETFQTRPLVPSFTWSGGSAVASESSFDWSLGANWLGGEIPTSDEAVRALTFPRLSSACEGERPGDACYDSYSDVSGLSAEALRLDNANDYVIAGDQISVGSGGLTASPASGPVGPAGDVIAAPLQLSSSQRWNVSGRGSLNEEAGLLLAGDVGGVSSALEIGLSEEPVVYLAENNIEVGPLSINGTDAAEPGVFNGVVGLLNGKLNASDGQPVYLGHLFLTGSGAVGELTTNGAEVDVGDPANGIEAASATLDPASRIEFNVVGSGATPKGEYSQLVSQGAIALGGANLGVVVRPPKAGAPCPTLVRGHTYTFVSTTGTLSGAFSNAPVGDPELPVRFAEACPAKSQTMRIGYHESGAVQTVTGTVEEDAVTAEEEASAKHRAEEEAAKHGALEEVFVDRRAEETAIAKRRTEEAVATLAGAAAATGPSQGVAAFTTSVAAKTPDVRLAVRELLANRAGYVSLRVSCRVGESRCVGTLILHNSNAFGAQSSAANRSAAPLMLATGQFSVPGGHTATVVLRLTARARLLLSHMHLLHVRATIVVHHLAGAWRSSVASVTIRSRRQG